MARWLNPLPTHLWALSLLLGALLAPAARSAENEFDPARDAEHFGPAEKLLFWEPRQQLAGFRNIDKLLPTRPVRRGDLVHPLVAAPRDFADFSYELDGKRFGLDDFMRDHRLVGLIAIQNDQILTERYTMGNGPRTRWISYSVAKSVVSMLTGAAIRDGYIRSVDDKVTDYLPLLKGTSYDAVTLRDVLHMASGTNWNEDYADPRSDVNTMPRGILNQLRQLGQNTRVAPPGEKFNYNTGETNLMGAILRAAIGNNLATYLENKIWQPFGMESDASWLLHEPGGGENGGCCINATLRDYARLGLFAMRDGVLPDGTRVLPEGWMQESTTPSKGYAGYGYLWWLSPSGYSALGIFGQTIFVNRDLNLVVATHGSQATAVSDDYERHREAFYAALVAYLGKR